MFKICAHQFRQAFFSPRLYLALILGCTIQIISVFPLLDFSKAMGEPLGIFEAFIYFNTDTYTATCAFLGAVLMVSDIHPPASIPQDLGRRKSSLLAWY